MAGGLSYLPEDGHEAEASLTGKAGRKFPDAVDLLRYRSEGTSASNEPRRERGGAGGSLSWPVSRSGDLRLCEFERQDQKLP